jgi:hypothetical protein
MDIKVGEECKFKDLDNTDLERIASDVLEQIEKKLEPQPTSDEKKLISIKYLHNKEIQLPQWLLNRRGHDLLGVFSKKWKYARRDILQHHLKKIRLIPKDLFDTLNNVLYE